MISDYSQCFSTGLSSGHRLYIRRQVDPNDPADLQLLILKEVKKY